MAEAILDGTLAYQAAQAVHQLRATLGIEIQQINLAISPTRAEPGIYRVVCTTLSVGAQELMEIQLTTRAREGNAGSNGG